MNVIQIELIYDSSCPNIEAARAVLSEALAKAGLPAHWQEWNKDWPTSPEYARNYGSPTILVNGRDVVGVEPEPDADCCRVYFDHGDKRVPALEVLIAAFKRS